MNLNQASQPTERVDVGKRISELWNSRNRIARLTILVTTGLVLNCCCVIIPLSSKANSLAPQANIGANALSTPAFTTTQDPFIPTASVISANMEFDHNGDGRVACKDFSSPAAAQEAHTAAHPQFDGSAKDGRSCKSVP